MKHKYYLQSFHARRPSTHSNQGKTKTRYTELSSSSCLEKDWKKISGFYIVYLDPVFSICYNGGGKSSRNTPSHRSSQRILITSKNLDSCHTFEAIIEL